MILQAIPGSSDLAASGSELSADPVINVHHLDWDTDFFGARMGSIIAAGDVTDLARYGQDTIAAHLRSTLDDAAADGYEHLIFRVPAEQLATAWGAAQAGMRLVDLGVDSTFAFRGAPASRPGGTIRPYRAEDLTWLRELAATAFTLSRFAVDPFFSEEQAKAFHRQWITNLCAGLAQAVLICELDGRPAGFVSCSLSGDEGRIPLIATDAAFRRRGVGASLVAGALDWFHAAGARVAHVKTQAVNYPALALYHGSGFAVSKSELTFSISIGSGSPAKRRVNP